MDGQVADLVDVLAGRPAVVFGHSYGGNVALAAGRPAPGPGAGGRRLRDAAAVARLVADDDGRRSTAAAADDDPADAAERFMRRMIGDERWERLPRGTRAARRAEGAAMVGELVDIDEHVPWDPARITVPAVAMRGSDGPARTTAGRRRTSRDVLADCPVVTIEGARHFGPNTHPDAVAAVLAELVSRAATPR